MINLFPPSSVGVKKKVGWEQYQCSETQCDKLNLLHISVIFLKDTTKSIPTDIYPWKRQTELYLKPISKASTIPITVRDLQTFTVFLSW